MTNLQKRLGYHQSILKWIMSHTLHVQVSLIVLALLASVVLGAFSYTSELIISLLLIICTEFFVLSVGYMEDFKDRLEKYQRPKSDVEFIKRSDFSLREYLPTAQNDVFISGFVLEALFHDRELLDNWDNRISLHLLGCDLDDEAIILAHKNTFRQNQDISVARGRRDVFINYFKTLDKSKNIQLATSNRLMPYVFVAIDIIKPSPNSLIKVQHTLCEVPVHTQTVSYIVRPGSELFEIYKKQIELLWDTRKQ